MSTYKRLPRGKDRGHDEFKGWTLHAIIWLKGNWRSAAELLGVAAVALAVIVGASSHWSRRSAGAAERLFAAANLPSGSEGQMEALREVASRYPRTPAGQQAMMKLGAMRLSRGEHDEAIAEFRLLAARSRSRAMLNVAALHMTAASELAKGDAAAAAEGYLKAASDPHNLLGNLSRYRAAECYERAGDAERAAQLYRQIVAEAKEEDRAVRQASEERLIWLIANQKAGG